MILTWQQQLQSSKISRQPIRCVFTGNFQGTLQIAGRFLFTGLLLFLPRQFRRSTTVLFLADVALNIVWIVLDFRLPLRPHLKQNQRRTRLQSTLQQLRIWRISMTKTIWYWQQTHSFAFLGRRFVSFLLRWLFICGQEFVATEVGEFGPNCRR